MKRGAAGRMVTFLTLNLDLFMIAYLIVASGALRSPVLPIQLIFTLFFAMLFPRPWGIIPPLLLLPLVAHLDQLLYGRGFVTQDIFILIFYSSINLIIVYAVVYLSGREETQQAEIVDLTRELRELAVREERQRISREMHDGLGALLSSMIMQAEYLSSLQSSDEVRREIAEIRGTAEESMDELRRCVQMMRDDFDMRQALEDFCRNFAARGRVELEFSVPAQTPPIRPDRQLMVFRVLQEALSNALRHASPHRISVIMSDIGDCVVLKVSDDGRGFDPKLSPAGHYGLANMRERARKSAAECELSSAPGAGTTVTLTIPKGD
jgi:signal transduction histidine kinase